MAQGRSHETFHWGERFDKCNNATLRVIWGGLECLPVLVRTFYQSFVSQYHLERQDNFNSQPLHSLNKPAAPGFIRSDGS